MKPEAQGAWHRKRRTRDHVLADLAVNHVERQVLIRGFTADRLQHDYGIDLVMSTYDVNGLIQNGQVLIQVKGQHRSTFAGAKDIPFRLDRRDLSSWLKEPEPVILALYDGPTSTARWLYVQAYFEARGIPSHEGLPETVTVHVPRANLLDVDAVGELARFRDNVMLQISGKIRHVS
jgi:hypothetical protein